jgi:hypothetical protein
MKEHPTMRSTQVYAPDGMTGFSAARENYDDGLVHNHNWAAASHDRPSSAGFGGLPAANRFRAYDAVQAHERFDDGLVHNHDWAVGGK